MFYKQLYLRNEFLFSGFTGNELERGTNNSREPPRAICLFLAPIHSP